jgi:hypothetical protein
MKSHGPGLRSRLRGPVSFARWKGLAGKPLLSNKNGENGKIQGLWPNRRAGASSRAGPLRTTSLDDFLQKL